MLDAHSFHMLPKVADDFSLEPRTGSGGVRELDAARNRITSRLLKVLIAWRSSAGYKALSAAGERNITSVAHSV
jgi:hypothetical protein